MAASVSLNVDPPCAGGEHFHGTATLNVNGVVRTRSVRLDRTTISEPITDEDLDTYFKIHTRIVRAQTTLPNLRTALNSTQAIINVI